LEFIDFIGVSMRGVILLGIESAPLSEDEDENENDISD